MFEKIRWFSFLALLFLVGSLSAADAYVDNTWSGKGGNTDLATAANWSQGWTAQNEIHQMMRKLPSGTFTMSRDLTICAFRMEDANKEIVFDFGRDRTLTLTGVDMTPFRFRFGAAGTVFRLASGTIRQVYEPNSYTYTKAETSQYMLLPETAGCHDETFVVDGPDSRLETRGLRMNVGTNTWLVVTNGAQVVGNVMLTDKSRAGSGCGVKVAGAASVFNPTGEALDANGIYTLSTGGTAENFTLEYLQGARLWPGCMGINVGTNGCGAVLAYRGAGTVVEHTGSYLLIGSGKGASANRVEVTDGATLKLCGSGSNGRFWLGSHIQSVSNVLYVAGEGTVVTGAATGSSFVGQRSAGNLVHLDDHAVMALSGSIAVGNSSGTASEAYDNSGNRLLVENGATFSCANLQVGLGRAANPSRDDAVIIRAGGRVDASGAVEIAGGESSVAEGSFIRVEGTGSRLVGKSNLRVGRYSGQCGFELFDGARAAFEGYAYLGDNAAVSAGTNHLTVVDSELVVGGRFATFGADDVIAVTNGTIYAADMYLTYSNAAATNLQVFVAGTNPVLRAVTGGITLRNDAHVHFSVPKHGYAEPVFQCAGKFDIRNAMMSFELEDGFERGSREAVLVEAGEVGCFDSSKRKIEAALPEGVRLKIVAEGGKSRVLLRPCCGGTLLTIR